MRGRTTRAGRVGAVRLRPLAPARNRRARIFAMFRWINEAKYGSFRIDAIYYTTHQSYTTTTPRSSPYRRRYRHKLDLCSTKSLEFAFPALAVRVQSVRTEAKRSR